MERVRDESGRKRVGMRSDGTVSMGFVLLKLSLLSQDC